MRHLEGSILTSSALYFTDNGAVYHGRCCGVSAQMTGRDISGQEVQRVSAADREWAAKEGWTIDCETCGDRKATPEEIEKVRALLSEAESYGDPEQAGLCIAALYDEDLSALDDCLKVIADAEAM